jgi:uncharacterized protein
MKRVILILFVFVTASILLSAQDTLTTFYDDKWEAVTDKDKAAYYRKAFLDNEVWTVRDYFKSDKLQMTGTFKSKKFTSKQGHFVYYYENGHKQSEGDYINDKREGHWVFWYDNGNKKTEGNVVAENWEGIWTYWFDSGEKKAEGIYVRNNKDGDWRYWYRNGQLESIEKYKYGLITSAEVYYKNGELKYKGNFLNNNRSGSWTFYNVDGRAYFSGNYALGLRKGEWVRYFQEGQMIVNYNNGIIEDKEFGGMVKKKWDDNH